MAKLKTLEYKLDNVKRALTALRDNAVRRARVEEKQPTDDWQRTQTARVLIAKYDELYQKVSTHRAFIKNETSCN